jgi:molybdate transport system ATP-binding protein
MHLYFRQNQPCIEIVGSGFFDSIGLHRKCSAEQSVWALEWMKVFRIDYLREVPFLKLSFGEQRLVMLARAFVKNPELLILDEPLHGLDRSNKQLVARIIDTFCKRPNKTLIYVTHYLNEIPECVSKRFQIRK